MKQVDLIIHPVRLRIIEVIGNEALTTQEIADYLPDVPKSSLYRHLKQLLKGGVVRVWDTRLVNGIEEKTYRLGHGARLTPDDLKGVSAAEHINYFTTFIASMLRSFGDYVNKRESAGDEIDFVKDHVGYNEVTFYANHDEIMQMQALINQAVVPLLSQPEGNGRIRHKLTFVIHPILEQEATE